MPLSAAGVNSDGQLADKGRHSQPAVTDSRHRLVPQAVGKVFAGSTTLRSTEVEIRVSPSVSILHACRALLSPRAHLRSVGMLRFMSHINQPSLPTPPLLCSYVCFCFMVLSSVFHSINAPDNSVFLVCSSGLTLPYWYFQLILIKVSFSPDILPSG